MACSKDDLCPQFLIFISLLGETDMKVTTAGKPKIVLKSLDLQLAGFTFNPDWSYA